MTDQGRADDAIDGRSTISVLYVASEERRREGIEVLREADWEIEILEAGSLDEALDRVQDRPFDCLITVQQLPDGAGVDLCKEIQLIAPELRTVLVVADGTESVAAEAVNADVDAYVQGTMKSTPEQVREQVRSVIDVERDSSTEFLQTFRALQEANQELTSADTVDEVCEIAITVARDVLGLPLSGIHLHRDGALEPVAITAEVEEAFGTPPTYTPDDEFVWNAYKRRESELFEHGEELRNDTTASPVESGMILPLGTHGIHLVTATEPRAFSQTDRFFAELLASTTEAALDRAKATERLRAQRDRFARLFESVPDPVVEYRFDTDQPIIEAVNDTFERVFGYSEAEVRGRGVDELLVPTDERGTAQSINDRAAAGERVQREVDRLTADGRQTFLLRNAPWEDGDGGYAVYVDISDRKEHERTVTALHGATRTLVRANSVESIAETIVETARNVVGLPYSAVFHYDESDDRLEAVAVTERSVETLGEPPTFEPAEGIVGQVFKTGEPMVLDNAHDDDRGLDDDAEAIRSYCALPLGDHGVLTIAAPTVGEFDDQTVEIAELLASNATTALDRLDREQELRAREETLRKQNERLESFASVVSHDLRNPLTLLSGSIELAETTGDPEHFEDAHEAIDRMETLIDDILVLARQGQTVDSVRPTGVHKVAEEAWAEIPAEDSVVDIDGEFIAGTDPDRLRQLLANLFRNAIEHASDGEDPPRIEFGVLDDRSGFYVADDGPGIPDDQREQVFDHGFTTSSGGTGLGLKIVADIAAAHGWDVIATESRWGGTRIEIRGVENVSFDGD